MKKLLFKLIGFGTICLLIVSSVLMGYGGSVDYFYNKFTTPKAKSMIIGDSRSLQGIQPAVLIELLKDTKFDLPVFNYSFTGAQAVAGPLYNESILKKLDDTSTNGLFIISVTPEFVVSDDRLDNEKGEFREAGAPPHNMKFVTMNPNFEYFFKNIRYFHFTGIFRQSTITHKDGWLEESNLPKDTLIYNSWRKNQIALFLKDREHYYISSLRLEHLKKLIRTLKKHGSVYLVRMPISEEFLSYEDWFYPSFNEIMDSLAQSQSVPYFNYNTNGSPKYRTYDGHHIDKYGGREFTADLGKKIQATKR